MDKLVLVKALTNDACKEMDAQNKVAPANSTYTKRLNNIAKALGNEVNGTPVNYKVGIEVLTTWE